MVSEDDANGQPANSGEIEDVVEGRARDLGGFDVRRVLPARMGATGTRRVGPFVFFDHFGPVTFAAGQGMDVRPHPHIALATLTYLFDGEILHRDSLGSQQVIRPGDVNWMVAGQGIVHSERTPPDVRARGGKMHGIQTWLALPLADEETAPRFEHHAQAAIPVVRRPGAELHIVAGTAYGLTAPTGVVSPTLYVYARLEAGATIPVDDQHPERAVYVVDGTVSCGGRSLAQGMMALLRAGASSTVQALTPARVLLVGGGTLEGERHIYWNFVSSTRDRIERAKADWREGRFAKVPGDDVEFIPLPPG
jgi:redox-sensitive bicupin YhaK (pirin superfamily)